MRHREISDGALRANECKPAKTGVRYFGVLVSSGGLMSSISAQHDDSDARQRLASVGRGIVHFSWAAVRLPLLALLVTMEPIVCWVLSAIAVLGVLVSLLFEFVVRLPNYPFWLMLGLSVGIAALQIPYYLLIRLFSSR